jgi:outer membrane protein OmpU
MNNLKKVGLTALAASLVATSAFSAEFGVSGSAGITIENNSQSAAGKAFSMPNSVYLSGSGETDGGLNISVSFELDQGAATTQPFDNHSVSVGNDSIGTLTLHGHGGSSAQSALDTTAAGDLWDNGFDISTAHDPSTSATSNNMLYYSLPSLVDGLGAAVSYTPDGTGHQSSTAFSLTYSGIEGLSVSYGYGDDNSSVGVDADATTIKASYAVGSFTLGLSNTDYSTTTASSDQDVTSWNVAYTVSDSISVAYGAETHELEGSATDIEVSGLSASYTAGGMTISAASIEADNVGHSTAATADREYWKLGASFAF